MTTMLLVSGSLWIRYAVYAAIILVGVIVLLLLRRFSRLPSHAELKNRMKELSSQVAEAEKHAANGYDRLKTASKLLYQLDKLVYITSELAQKERDGDLDMLCTMLEQARAVLFAYRSGAEGQDLGEVARKLDEGLALLERILARDAELKKKAA